MWNAGSITRETLYWQEGFAEWLPIGSIQHLLEPTPPTPSIGPHVFQTAVASPQKAETLGIVLVVLPIGAAIVMGVARMFIGQNLIVATMISLATVLLTAVVMTIEASQLGMGSETSGKRTTGPLMWFFGGVLFWVVCYPAYLFMRSRFGVANYLAGGIVAAVAFLGVSYYANSGTVPRKASIAQRSEQTANPSPVPTATPIPPNVQEFVREARRLESAIATGVSFQDFHAKVSNLLATAEEAVAATKNTDLQKNIAVFMQALLDTDSLWAVKIKGIPLSDGTRAEKDYLTYSKSSVGDYNSEDYDVSMRWRTDVSKLACLYEFANDQGNPSNFNPFRKGENGLMKLHIDDAIQKLFFFSSKVFKKIEAQTRGES